MPRLTLDTAYWEWKASILPPAMDGRVLDVGCYEGYFSKIAKSRGATEVIAIEPPLDDIECDYDSLPSSNNGIEYRRCSVYDTSLFGSFDHIIFFDVLYHLTSPVDALRELRCTLSSSGLIYLCSLFANGDESILHVLEEGWAGDKTNWFVPTIPAIKRLCQRSGLRFMERSRRNDRVLGLCLPK